MNDLKIVVEGPTRVANNDLQILTETKDSSGNVEKVVFKAILQESDEVNGNKRIYTKPICGMIVEGLEGKANSRSLYQEIDHPFVSSPDQNVMKRRATIIELKNCGSMIRNIRMEGKKVIAEIESLSGFQGPSFRDLIVKDKADIGFSLRAFSRLKAHNKFEGVTEVTGPLRAITYDVVTNPSHKNARVVSLLNEGETIASLITDDEEAIMECMNELALDGVNPPDNGTVVSDYMKVLIREAFDNHKPLYFNI
jgi:hypothetical protein